MAQANLDVSNFVDVTVEISPTAAPYSLFGVPLTVGDSNVIDVTTRVDTFSTIQQAGNLFGGTTPEFTALEVFFEQSPQPDLAMVGRWASTATAGLLEGAILTPTEQLITNFTTVSSGSFFVYIDGIPHAITGVNLSAQTNLNGVASQIQAQLPAGVTCVWNSEEEYFVITSSTTGVLSAVSYLAAPTAIGHWTYTAVGTIADTITIGTSTISYIANGGTPSGLQIALGTTQLTTMAATLAFLNASTDTQVSICTYVSDGVSKIYAIDKTPGVGGDTVAIAASSTAVTASGADLAGATGTDISTLVGGTTAMGALAVPGIAAETPLAAVQACANVSNVWYGLTFPQNTAVLLTLTDYTAIAAYILASSRSRMFGVTLYGNGTGAAGGTACLNASITNDLASVLQSLNNKRIVMMYSSSNPAAVETLYGRAFTTDWNGSNTAYTLAYKQAPGITAENLTQSQFTAMVGKGVNADISVDNNTQFIWPGQMSQGYFFDEVHGTDWFANRVQTDVFNVLYTTPTKVPQTDPGMNMIAAAINGSNAAAVNNGFVAPGQWNGPPVGSLATGATMTTGYYLYYPPIASQSEATRETRVAVPFQDCIKLAGAVQEVDVTVFVNR